MTENNFFHTKIYNRKYRNEINNTTKNRYKITNLNFAMKKLAVGRKFREMRTKGHSARSNPMKVISKY